MKKKSPEMIAGNWHPTPDPAGRQVQFTNFDGTVMQGTVVEVEYDEDKHEDREATVWVDVTEPETMRGERGVSDDRLTWLDGRPWARSKSPSGRFVIVRLENQDEYHGQVVCATSRHCKDAILTVLLEGPEGHDLVELPWRGLDWLPA